MHELARKMSDDLCVTRGITVLTSDIDAKDCFKSVVIIYTICQLFEHGLSLMDHETTGQNPLTGLAEQLPHYDTCIARAAYRIRPADDDLHRYRRIRSGFRACDKGAKQKRNMGGLHISADKFSETFRH